jgi:hypothetical protein
MPSSSTHSRPRSSGPERTRVSPTPPDAFARGQGAFRAPCSLTRYLTGGVPLAGRAARTTRLTVFPKKKAYRLLRDQMGSPGGELNSYRLITREVEAGVGAASQSSLRPLTRLFLIHSVPTLTHVFHRFAHGSRTKMSAGDEEGELRDSVPPCAISAPGRSHRDIMTS